MRVSVHLPCNLIVQETGSTSLVAALDPLDVLEDGDNVNVEAAEAARTALTNVLEKISGAAA
jgi:uncharacterized protein (DUF302 family)